MDPTTRFVFLNTTDGPRLSPPDAKVMRGHVTRTNFAHRRRRRKCEIKKPEDGLSAVVPITHQRQHGKLALSLARTPSLFGSIVDLHLADSLVALTSADALQHTQSCMKPDVCITLGPLHPPGTNVSNTGLLLTAKSCQVSQFYAIAFQGSDTYPSTGEEQAWIQLQVSDPAFAEISVALGLKHWSPDARYQHRAAAHSSRANRIMIERIQSQSATAYSDGGIAAVMHLALGERLMQNQVLWLVHIRGLATLLKERFYRNTNTALPPFAVDFLVW